MIKEREKLGLCPEQLPLSEREMRLLQLHWSAKQYIYANEQIRSGRLDEQEDAFQRELRQEAMDFMIEQNTRPGGDRSIMGSFVAFVEWDTNRRYEEYRQKGGTIYERAK